MAGAGLVGLSSMALPARLLAAAGPELKINITGRCTFNSIVVTNERQEGLPNPYRAQTPFSFVMNDDCSGLEAGITAVREGKAHIGTLLRTLTDAEKAAGLRELSMDPMAYAVAVSRNNPVKNLTRDQVLRIFAGQIRNWKEVGGPDADILLYKQRCGASYDKVMERHFAEGGIGKDADRLEEAVMYVEVTDNQLEKIAENDMSIAMVPRMFFDRNSKHLSVDGVLPTRATERDGSYPFFAQRALVFDANAPEAVRKFLAFVKSENGMDLMEKGFAMDWLATGF